MSEEKIMRLLDDLEDETPPSIGQEVGAALGMAVQGISKSNRDMAESLSLSISKAMNEAMSRQVIHPEKPIQNWVFKVERNDKGLMTQITATAQ